MTVRATTLALMGLLLPALCAAPARAQQPGGEQKPEGEEQPIEIEEIGGKPADLQGLVGGTEAVTITGFAVPEYRADFHTGENSFQGSKLAVSLFRPVGQGESLYFFGQLTAALEDEEEPGDDGEAPAEASFSTEIDNLIVSWTPTSLNQLNLSLGKFDAPVGFERDDEPLNLQATNSFNFEFGRPVKVVGLVTRYTASPVFDLAAYLVNGWEVDSDNNEGKTVGGRIGLTPAEWANVGLSVVYGPEQDDHTRDKRCLANLDWTLQPTDALVLGGEANLGSEDRESSDELEASLRDAKWYGGSLTAFYHVRRTWGLTLRYEWFKDRDGSRTGVPQILQSYTIAPVYIFGEGREGIFSVIEHTSFHLPRFQLRAELRLNRSTEPFFPEDEGTGRFGAQGVVQGVFLF